MRNGTHERRLMEYKIITSHITPPVPSKMFDWEAHLDGHEELGSAFGETEKDALIALAEKLWG